jgi:hypothetical protein
MRQLCGRRYGAYNSKHVGPPLVAGDRLPGSLIAESINELDLLIGTRGIIPRLPLQSDPQGWSCLSKHAA